MNAFNQTPSKSKLTYVQNTFSFDGRIRRLEYGLSNFINIAVGDDVDPENQYRYLTVINIPSVDND
jgi:uncharacterized membrane protein YhaH (DUF805 family)